MHMKHLSAPPPLWFNDRCLGPDSGAANAVHRRSSTFPLWIVFLQLQFIDKVIDVGYAGPANSGVAVRRQSRSHSCGSSYSFDNVVVYSCSTLIRWSTFVVQVQQFSSAYVEETAELPQVHLVEFWTGCCMPVVCNDRCRMVDDMAQFIDSMDVPVIMQRRLRQWKCPYSVHRRSWWTFSFATEGRHGGGVEG